MFLVETGSIVADQTFLSLFPASIETEAEYTFVKVGIVKLPELFTKCMEHVVEHVRLESVETRDRCSICFLFIVVTPPSAPAPPALLRSGIGRRRACGTRWLTQPGVKFCKCIQAAVGGVLGQTKTIKRTKQQKDAMRVKPQDHCAQRCCRVAPPFDLFLRLHVK